MTNERFFELGVYIIAAIIFLGAAAIYGYFLIQPGREAPSGVLIVLGFGLSFIRDLLKDKEANRLTEKVASRAANGAAEIAVRNELERRDVKPGPPSDPYNEGR